MQHLHAETFHSCLFSFVKRFVLVKQIVTHIKNLVPYLDHTVCLPWPGIQASLSFLCFQGDTIKGRAKRVFSFAQKCVKQWQLWSCHPYQCITYITSILSQLPLGKIMEASLMSSIFTAFSPTPTQRQRPLLNMGKPRTHHCVSTTFDCNRWFWVIITMMKWVKFLLRIQLIFQIAPDVTVTEKDVN